MVLMGIFNSFLVSKWWEFGAKKPENGEKW